MYRCARDHVLGDDHSKPLCDWDIKPAPVRFYQIDIEVTDYAGNIGNAQGTVIILHKGYQFDFKRVPEF